MSSTLLGELMNKKISGPKRGSASRDKSPKRESHNPKHQGKHPKSEDKKKIKHEKKKDKKDKKQKKKPTAPKGYTKRFMPTKGDSDYKVDVIFPGTGVGPQSLDEPGHGSKSAEITRLRLVSKNGSGDCSMLALKGTNDRWEFLTKETQTKLITAQEFKTHLGEPITRAMIGTWLNRWPIVDPDNNDEDNVQISALLQYYPIVSDTYTSGMTQFKDKKFSDLGVRVNWADIRDSKKAEWPRPGHFKKENDDDDDDDPSSSRHHNSSSSGMEEDDHEFSDDPSEENNEDEKEKEDDEPPPAPKPQDDFRKPNAGPKRPQMHDFGNGLKSLRAITVSGETAHNTISHGSVRPSIGMSNVLYPEKIEVTKRDRDSSPKRPKKGSSKSKPPKAKEPNPKKTKPTKTPPAPVKSEAKLPVKNNHHPEMSIAQSNWTAKKLVKSYEALMKANKLKKRLDAKVIADLGNNEDKRTLKEFFNSEAAVMHELVFPILLELRRMDINISHPIRGYGVGPIATFVEALGMLDEENNSPAETIKAVQDLADFVKNECVIPETEPAKLIDHFTSGVLNDVSGLWMQNFMPLQKCRVQFDIGAKSAEERDAYGKGLNVNVEELNLMLSLVHLWRGNDSMTPPPPPPPSKKKSTDLF